MQTGRPGARGQGRGRRDEPTTRIGGSVRRRVTKVNNMFAANGEVEINDAERQRMESVKARTQRLGGARRDRQEELSAAERRQMEAMKARTQRLKGDKAKPTAPAPRRRSSRLTGQAGRRSRRAKVKEAAERLRGDAPLEPNRRPTATINRAPLEGTPAQPAQQDGNSLESALGWMDAMDDALRIDGGAGLVPSSSPVSDVQFLDTADAAVQRAIRQSAPEAPTPAGASARPQSRRPITKVPTPAGFADRFAKDEVQKAVARADAGRARPSSEPLSPDEVWILGQSPEEVLAGQQLRHPRAPAVQQRLVPAQQPQPQRSTPQRQTPQPQPVQFHPQIPVQPNLPKPKPSSRRLAVQDSNAGWGSAVSSQERAALAASRKPKQPRQQPPVLDEARRKQAAELIDWMEDLLGSAEAESPAIREQCVERLEQLLESSEADSGRLTSAKTDMVPIADLIAHFKEELSSGRLPAVAEAPSSVVAPTPLYVESDNRPLDLGSDVFEGEEDLFDDPVPAPASRPVSAGSDLGPLANWDWPSAPPAAAASLHQPAPEPVWNRQPAQQPPAQPWIQQPAAPEPVWQQPAAPEPVWNQQPTPTPVWQQPAAPAPTFNTGRSGSSRLVRLQEQLGQAPAPNFAAQGFTPPPHHAPDPFANDPFAADPFASAEVDPGPIFTDPAAQAARQAYESARLLRDLPPPPPPLPEISGNVTSSSGRVA